MDVTAFILDATNKAVKIDTAIKNADTAKEAVELAKAGFEAAKQEIAAAKDDFDQYADKSEEYGLTKAKFKDAVQRMKTILSDIGAVEAPSTDTADQAKPKTPRKRKGQDAAAPEHAGQNEPDTPEHSSTTETQKPETVAAEQPPVQEPIVVAAESENGDIGTDAGQVTVAEAAPTQVTQSPRDETVVKDVTASSPEPVKDDAASSNGDDDAEHEELDNSFAEQELLDFVDEVETSDDAVKAVLSAAVKVVSWHATAVAKTALRTEHSPLTLAVVLAAEDYPYVPADIHGAHATAMSHGSEKLAAAISWFNKALDLMAEGKDVEDFRFTELSKPVRAKKTEAAVEETSVTTSVEAEVPAEAAAEEVSEVQNGLQDDLDEVIDATAEGDGYAETIEDMTLFSEQPEGEQEQEQAPADPVASEPVEETAAPVPPRPSRPSWIK